MPQPLHRTRHQLDPFLHQTAHTMLSPKGPGDEGLIPSLDERRINAEPHASQLQAMVHFVRRGSNYGKVPMFNP
jgi:hypothetical protein